MLYVGAILVIAAIVIIGLWSAKNKDEKYDNSRSANYGLVAGALIGTLVGGSSTIGTAQLAYSYGFSAWWFTLGGGIGVLLLALVFAEPLYKSGANTLSDIFSRKFGRKSGVLSAVLSSIGTFLSFVAQIISGTALIMSISRLNYLQAIILVALLMIVYVYWGGSLALGYGGLAKTVLLSASVLICGTLAVMECGGFRGLWTSEMLPHEQYMNLFARGFAVDAGAGMSLVIGVITTQSYIGAILMARSVEETRKGALLTAIIVPIMGIASIFVGMYMHIYYPGIETKMALPMFIIEKMPPLAAGIMLSSLLIAVTGTGAGLSFGMASVIYRNIYKQFRPETSDRESKRIIQTILLCIIIGGSLLCYVNLGGYILNWSFLSMGLRGAVSFCPLIAALFCKKQIEERYALASMISGALFTFIGKFVLPSNIDPVFLGILASFAVMGIGSIKKT